MFFSHMPLKIKSIVFCAVYIEQLHDSYKFSFCFMLIFGIFYEMEQFIKACTAGIFGNLFGHL